jgi:hypothetical protein
VKFKHGAQPRRSFVKPGRMNISRRRRNTVRKGRANAGASPSRLDSRAELVELRTLARHK